MDFETVVKMGIYGSTAEMAEVPSLDRLSSLLDKPREEVEVACKSLAAKRLLVLDRETGEIRMAPPFSGVRTPHKVTIGDKTYSANCIWDAFGVAVALDRDADIATGCADCGEPMLLKVRNRVPVPEPCVIHYAVPAAYWWDDIEFT